MIVKLDRLADGARKAVKQATGGAVGVVHPFIDNPNSKRIRYKFTSIQVCVYLFSQAGFRLLHLSHEFTSGEMRYLKMLLQALRLGTFTCTGGADEDNKHGDYDLWNSAFQ